MVSSLGLYNGACVGSETALHIDQKVLHGTIGSQSPKLSSILLLVLQGPILLNQH